MLVYILKKKPYFIDEAVWLVLKLLCAICLATYYKSYDQNKQIWRPNTEESCRGIILSCKVPFVMKLFFTY